MTYEYEITEGPKKGQVVHLEHSIKDQAKTEVEIDGVVHKVRRVIAGPGAFILKGGSWSRDGYTHAVQPLSKEDRANLMKKP